MATYDNKIWLLKNIRDAFIETDDTGLCEAVMTGDDLTKIFQEKALEEKEKTREARMSRPGTSRGRGSMSDKSEIFERNKEVVTQFDPYPSKGDSEDEEPLGSYDRPHEFGGHRQRSNTAQWLDKKLQALKNLENSKTIRWEDSSLVTPEESAKIFVKEEIQLPPANQKSLFAQQLKDFPNMPYYKYLEYAKFDGTVHTGLHTKKFKIFMTMTIVPEELRNYPVVACVIASAKIKEVIGFTCFKFCFEHPEITLGSVDEYGLCIAEDDGEVDWALPCLDANEPCSKFGFTCLGLIELSAKSPPATCHIIEDSRFDFFTGDFIDDSQSGSRGRHDTGSSDTSVTVINAVKAHNEEKNRRAVFDMSKLRAVTEAPQMKTYRVQMLRKMRTSIATDLTVSLDKIEIQPVDPHRYFWSRPAKYFTHSIETIAWCQALEVKTRVTLFRLVYSPIHGPPPYGETSKPGPSTNHVLLISEYKIHDFECECEKAKEIVSKINTILDMRNSICRREYKIAKEKKLQARRSFKIMG